MGQTTWTETICDRCGKLEREERTHGLVRLPNEWRYLEIRIACRPEVKPLVIRKILCGDCGTALHEWLVFDPDKAL